MPQTSIAVNSSSAPLPIKNTGQEIDSIIMSSPVLEITHYNKKPLNNQRLSKGLIKQLIEASYQEMILRSFKSL